LLRYSFGDTPWDFPARFDSLYNIRAPTLASHSPSFPGATSHKIPQKRFNKRLLTVEEIVGQYKSYLNELKNKYKGFNIVFTVSPVRHLKDGMRENQISKSVLHLSIEELNKEFENVFYFPSYELLMDDLRDYRFYKSDMLHPNELAIDYVWDFFVNTFILEKTKSILIELEKINKGIEHKPFDPESEDHQNFLEKLRIKIRDFEKRNPNINTTNH